MNKNTFKRYESIFDLLVYRYLTNNSLEKNMVQVQGIWEHSGGRVHTSTVFCPNFRIEMKVKRAQNAAFDEVFFSFGKNYIKGKVWSP